MKTLVVIRDSVDYLYFRRGINLSTASKQKVELLENKFMRVLYDAIPSNVNILVLTSDQLRSEIEKLIPSYAKLVAIDPIYVRRQHISVELSLSEGNILFGAYPLRPKTRGVINSLTGLSGCDVWLTDDGVKSGRTLQQAISMLTEYRINVVSVAIGIMNLSASNSLFVPVHAARHVAMYDWLRLGKLTASTSACIDINTFAYDAAHRMRFSPHVLSSVKSGIEQFASDIIRLLAESGNIHA